MTKTSWGTKRTCPCGNGVRFYDLNKKEIECPSCGESINVEKLSISALENNLRKKPHSEIVEKKEDFNAKEKDKSSSVNKNLDVEVDTDNVSKTEVDEIIADKIDDKEKKNV